MKQAKKYLSLVILCSVLNIDFKAYLLQVVCRPIYKFN